MRDFKISLADAKNDQAEFKSNLNEIKKGNKKHKSKEQKKNALYNLEMLYYERNSIIEFFDEKKNKKLYNNRIKSIQRNSIEL